MGLSVPVVDEPSALLDLGLAAEANGWDGVFLWHHVVGTPDFPAPSADAWVLLGAGCQGDGWCSASGSASRSAR